MRFSYPQIVLQEVPDEISLALSISGCGLQCKGCHSVETWDKSFGEELTTDTMSSLLTDNIHITCVLFYGGEWELDTLKELISKVKKNGKKVALYTGEELSYFEDAFLYTLDYIKVGKYVDNLGGLGSKNTNQKLYIIKNNELKERYE